jgi:hypothetical protein
MRNIEVLPTRMYDGATRVSSTDMNHPVVLGDASAEVILVPDGAALVKLTGSKDMYAAFGSTAVTAVIPSTDHDAATGLPTEFLPYSKGEHWRWLSRTNSSSTAARGISVISSSAQVVVAQFWKE